MVCMCARDPFRCPRRIVEQICENADGMMGATGYRAGGLLLQLIRYPSLVAAVIDDDDAGRERLAQAMKAARLLQEVASTSNHPRCSLRVYALDTLVATCCPLYTLLSFILLRWICFLVRQLRISPACASSGSQFCYFTAIGRFIIDWAGSLFNRPSFRHRVQASLQLLADN